MGCRAKRAVQVVDWGRAPRIGEGSVGWPAKRNDISFVKVCNERC